MSKINFKMYIHIWKIWSKIEKQYKTQILTVLQKRIVIQKQKSYLEKYLSFVFPQIHKHTHFKLQLLVEMIQNFLIALV